MHLQVSVVVLLILLTGGFSLHCYDCKNGQHYCPMKTCSSAECRSTKTVDYYVVSSRIPNGKRCFTCDSEDCSKTISCWANEDHCFTAYEPYSHQSVAIKGCASKSACDQEPGNILGLKGNIICCEGNLCNGAQSVTQSFLFLCCSLLSYFLLH